MVVGISVVFDSSFDVGWRSEMDIMLIATWDGKEGEVFTDLDLSEKVLGCKIWDITDDTWKTNSEIVVGHNLHGEFKTFGVDLLTEVKKASGAYFGNEGKRYALNDLARWNRCRALPVELITKIKRNVAWIKGQHIKVARWAIEDARLCFDLYKKIEKSGEVKISDAMTGKKPTIPIMLRTDEEE
tara:strand:+ start:16660 stop:17214 length:555 start_codon:yes stop_codon:yes gene_type:complete